MSFSGGSSWCKTWLVLYQTLLKSFDSILSTRVYIFKIAWTSNKHFITSHSNYRICSCLKRRTAKPLNMVCRTGIKQMTGRTDRFQENIKHWSWCEIVQQTYSEAASSYRKCMIADSGEPCTLCLSWLKNCQYHHHFCCSF